ncbi:MAG: hypothetical protein CMM60_14000 [Rhodospirillaceae bacterium]|jgi:hypothetical protein|nr:hypothetical protein [Rhodospirillaceae bacterium]|tara:strand:+ start:6500 stop:7768 length:1269 start_codon:yes stop_codon:yes gene_type:complete
MGRGAHVMNEKQAVYSSIEECRVCAGRNLEHLLELGEQPLANSLKASDEVDELRIPLTLCYCADCSLVQILETVEKEVLFSHYVWVSGTALATREFASELVTRVLAQIDLKPQDLILEIGSNDGTFLRSFLDSGFTNIVGVDPAENIAEIANHNGIRTISGFWNSSMAASVQEEHGAARIAIARNVIPHTSELRDVVAALAAILSSDGVGVIEFHDASKILDGLQYDSIYHEHLCYFSIKSVGRLLEDAGLNMFHAEAGPLSGGATLVYFSKENRPCSADLKLMEKAESDVKVNQIETWRRFAQQCIEHRDASLELLSTFSDDVVLGFGCSARSSTYLNFCGIDDQYLAAIVDNNAIKQGLYSPGSSIQIVSMEEGMSLHPKLIVVLAWNFQKEIAQLCRDLGYTGEFLLPFPSLPLLKSGV